MKPLWSLYWSVCLLRRGPEDMPYSPALLALALLLNLGLGVAIQWLSEPVAPGPALGIVLLALGLDAVVLGGMVLFKRRASRFVQGLATLYGVDVLLGLLALPLVAASAAMEDSFVRNGLMSAQVVLVAWNLGVRGFVYHRTVEIGILQGHMLSLTLFLLHILLAAKFFPELLLPATGN